MPAIYGAPPKLKPQTLLPAQRNGDSPPLGRPRLKPEWTLLAISGRRCWSTPASGMRRSASVRRKTRPFSRGTRFLYGSILSACTGSTKDGESKNRIHQRDAEDTARQLRVCAKITSQIEPTSARPEVSKGGAAVHASIPQHERIYPQKCEVIFA